MPHHAVLRVILGWALLNGAAIVFFAALFLVEQKWMRPRRGGFGPRSVSGR